MPIYEYENAAGERVEMFRPIARRDCGPKGFRRVINLTGRGLYTGRALDPTSADVAVPRAFRALEATMPRDRIEKQTGFSVRQLKRTWNFK